MVRKTNKKVSFNYNKVSVIVDKDMILKYIYLITSYAIFELAKSHYSEMGD